MWGVRVVVRFLVKSNPWVVVPFLVKSNPWVVVHFLVKSNPWVFVRFLVKSIPRVWWPYPFHSLLFVLIIAQHFLAVSYYCSLAPFCMHDPQIYTGDTVWY